MNPLFVGVASAVKRSLARHQGRPVRKAERLPMWRLLLDEVVHLARTAVRPPWVWVLVCLVLVAGVVMVVLDERTPGPALTVEWRMVVAIAAGIAAGFVVHRSRDRNDG